MEWTLDSRTLEGRAASSDYRANTRCRPAPVQRSGCNPGPPECAKPWRTWPDFINEPLTRDTGVTRFTYYYRHLNILTSRYQLCYSAGTLCTEATWHAEPHRTDRPADERPRGPLRLGRTSDGAIHGCRQSRLQ